MATNFKDELGPTVVYVPDHAIVDICFVHGLNGGNVSTWKKGEVFWPYNLLAKNLPEARIISWGYDADVAHFLSPTSANRVKDHAKGLSNDLRGLRGSPVASTRPIIFIAHSLGGIVCAQSSSVEPDNVEKISDHTAALTFMGTPFEGSKAAAWADMFRRLSKTLGEEFPKWLNSRRSPKKKRVRVMCFFEEKASQPGGHIVPRESAEIPGEDSRSLPDDHVGICKFENDKDPKYKMVLDKLSGWVDEIKLASNAEKHKAVDFNPQASFSMGKNYGGIQTGQDVSRDKKGARVSNKFNFASKDDDDE
ncbi:MAG: hypothetical protein Q9205_003183 [Flavoplaca limonia]